MARNPAAVWDPLPTSSAGAFTGGPKKGVAHKVQGKTYAGARATYLSRSLGPHFTIDEDGGLYQHLDTSEASSAVANDSGGVQTNRDGAIQVEVVGFSGVTSTPAQIVTFVELQRWLHAQEGIPPMWPMGRPPKDSASGYGEDNGHRDPAVWDSTAGWYGHSQVPENQHWDPAWTDEEWAAITAHPTQGAFMALSDTEQTELLERVRAMHVGNWVSASGQGDLAWLERVVTTVVAAALGKIPAATGGVTPDQIKTAVQAALREGTG